MYHISPDVIASALKVPKVVQLGYSYTSKLANVMMKLFCGKTIKWGKKKNKSHH